jgi:dipeptidase E
MKRLLLLSNSTNLGEPFLQYPLQEIKNFLGDATRIAFVPYAGVKITFEEYVGRVREKLAEIGLTVTGVNEVADPKQLVRESDAVMIGGGNTFHLLTHLYRNGLVDVIREKIESGAPYVGWSAGSNVACPTIRTTNDMPIIEPESFRALDLFPHQLNPHYTDARIPNLGGETRDDRLNEFIEVNKDVIVIGLREGTMLCVEGDEIKLIGPHKAKIFRYGAETVEMSAEEFKL